MPLEPQLSGEEESGQDGRKVSDFESVEFYQSNPKSGHPTGAEYAGLRSILTWTMLQFNRGSSAVYPRPARWTSR